MSWEDYSSKLREAERDKNRQAWTAVACIIGAVVLALVAKACS